MVKRGPLKVFYDGSCPLCIREIAFYQRQAGASRISWIDVSRTGDDDVAPGLSRVKAMSRFHVLDVDGELFTGGKAFAKIWDVLPRFRLLARLFRIQPFAWILDRAYDFFLKFRPYLQTAVRARCSRQRMKCMPHGPGPRSKFS
jgi:predicted DCC family thiol-disulfide oxidoreductase YuxK